MNAPRPGKKLLVLDLDYTLFDMKSAAEQVTGSSAHNNLDSADLVRPYTHWFLEKLYPHYDLIVWSQTSWKYIEMKLTDMGLLSNPAYNFAFVLDRTSMFPVESKLKDGTTRKHEVKPLEFIWRKFPGQYSAKNTIHIDDLSRNFAMNPKNGLKCVAYKSYHSMRATDKELYYIGHYLEAVAGVDDLTSLNHGEWREFLKASGTAL
mmetsp:Transcript_52225/g.122364  ORF Transcript_52225/g.122364 Transcript_52225/m.122364 type:complete len:206 (-) Transcript_52225:35-652(-)